MCCLLALQRAVRNLSSVKPTVSVCLLATLKHFRSRYECVVKHWFYFPWTLGSFPSSSDIKHNFLPAEPVFLFLGLIVLGTPGFWVACWSPMTLETLVTISPIPDSKGTFTGKFFFHFSAIILKKIGLKGFWKAGWDQRACDKSRKMSKNEREWISFCSK